jgi:hypothetical protein
LAHLVQKLGWAYVAVITTTEETPIAVTEGFATRCAELGITIAQSVSVTSIGTTGTEVTDDWLKTTTVALQTIKDSGARIILLSAFTLDVPAIVEAALPLGMMDYPCKLPLLYYRWQLGLLSFPINIWVARMVVMNTDVWVGSYNWLFDERLVSPSGVVGNYFQGVVGTSRPVDVTSAQYLDFEAKWAARYAADPEFMCRKSSVSLPLQSPHYDSFVYCFCLLCCIATCITWSL